MMGIIDVRPPGEQRAAMPAPDYGSSMCRAS
jgi:hypothetical protein